MPPADIDAYLAGLAPEAADAVAEVRSIVHATVPGAEERISYGIPTFARDGKAFLHVGAWRNHLSTYPVPAAGDDTALAAALAARTTGKGTLQLPYADGVPRDLIAQVAALLAEQHAPRT